MSYINKKLGNDDKEKVKEFLLGEGFEIRRDNFPDELTYFSKGSELSASITVDISEKTMHYYLEYRYGGGIVGDERVDYNYDDFEETYKDFIDEISDRIR